MALDLLDQRCHEPHHDGADLLRGPRAAAPRTQSRSAKTKLERILYASLGFSLLYMALDQGQRLDWYNSGTIVALAVTGAFLLLMAVVRRIIPEPNPLINLKFLLQR